MKGSQVFIKSNIKGLIKGFISGRTYMNAVIIFIVLFAVCAIVTPHFLDTQNLFNILKRGAPDIIMAVGMTSLILCSQFDLSLPGQITLCGGLLAISLKVGLPIFLCLIICFSTGAFIGLINGLLSTKLPSFIITLGMLTITGGLTLYLMHNTAIHELPENFLILARVQPLIPMQAIYTILIIVFFIILTRYTVFGRQLYEIGGNRLAARSIGVPIERRIITVFVTMGFLSSFAAFLIVARLNASHPIMYTDASFKAITALVIGGTSLFGGRGHVFGSVVGALIMTLLANLFNLMGFPTPLQGVVLGAVLITVIAIDYLRSRR